MMKLMPIVYVSDMGQALDFYQALGLTAANQDRSQMWVELTCGDAILALHHVKSLPIKTLVRLELAMVSDDKLETVVESLKNKGITLERELTDEAFGRSIAVRDPDGLVIQINEHDVSLYT